MWVTHQNLARAKGGRPPPQLPRTGRVKTAGAAQTNGKPQPLSPEAAALIAKLGLEPHPEGGFFRETYRGELVLDGLPHGAPRAAHTAIFFLLPTRVFSALHRVKSDEVWHFYDGDPLELHTIDERGHHVELVGRDIASGQLPQRVVPAGVWQAAIPTKGPRGFALCGCTVAPGFDFADFEMPGRAALLERFPESTDAVKRFTRPST